MSLPVNNKNAGKKAGKAKTNSAQGGSKFIAKPGKAAVAIKPVKTGGSRGS